MPLPLARAAAIDARRVIRARTRGRIAPTAGVLAALVAGPPVAVAVGRALAPALGPALRDGPVARAFVAGLALSALAAGCALGVAIPTAAALGAQVAAAGASVLDRALAMLALPVALVVLVGGVLALPVGIPVVGAAPGGPWVVVALAVTLLGALCLGGALAAAARGGGVLRRGALCLAGAAAVSALALPGDLVADALAGGVAPLAAAASAVPGAVLALAAWGVLVALVEDDGASASRSRWVPTSPLGATLVVALLALSRRRDLRAALLGAVLLGLAGIGLARVAEAPPPAAVLLGASGAVLAAAPSALAVGGALRESGHVWLIAPARGAVGVAWLVVSAGVMLAPPTLVSVVAQLADGGPVRGAAVALALSTGAWAAALTAGSLVPWRRDGAADQALSLGAFALLCGVLSLLSAAVGPRTAEAGVPAAVTAGAVLVLAGGCALAGVLSVLRARD